MDEHLTKALIRALMVHSEELRAFTAALGDEQVKICVHVERCTRPDIEGLLEKPTELVVEKAVAPKSKMAAKDKAETTATAKPQGKAKGPAPEMPAAAPAAATEPVSSPAAEETKAPAAQAPAVTRESLKERLKALVDRGDREGAKRCLAAVEAARLQDVPDWALVELDAALDTLERSRGNG